MESEDTPDRGCPTSEKMLKFEIHILSLQPYPVNIGLVPSQKRSKRTEIHENGVKTAKYYKWYEFV